MVQGLYNVKNGQPINAICFGDASNLAYVTKAQDPDSFNGKTLLTIAATASAIIFRKNIGNFIGKHFPNVAEFLTKNISKPVSEFFTKHGENSVVKFVKEAWNKTGTWGDSIISWFKNVKVAQNTTQATTNFPMTYSSGPHVSSEYIRF